MPRRLVIEAAVFVTYGKFLLPDLAIDYYIPYSTILELFDIERTTKPIMEDPAEDVIVKRKVTQFLQYLNHPHNRRTIDTALQTAWAVSEPIIYFDTIRLVIVNAIDQSQFTNKFDSIETELIMTALKFDAPLLCDQFQLQQNIEAANLGVHVLDIDEFADLIYYEVNDDEKII